MKEDTEKNSFDENERKLLKLLLRKLKKEKKQKPPRESAMCYCPPAW